ncbi:MAG: hypothetical protein AB7G39_11810 [Alphaproteobacteria bacterium]
MTEPDLSDFYLAFGKSSVIGNGRFNTTKKGDTIYIEGVVRHRINDAYDFKKDGFLANGALRLQNHHGAKVFTMRAEWTRRVTGTIRLSPDKGRQTARHEQKTAITLQWDDR